ncbi:MAG: YybS family protein, partial [Desulfobulbaceae bacterium]|nr:YybS family protein [Desulfobulbaceae bacterium]
MEDWQENRLATHSPGWAGIAVLTVLLTLPSIWPGQLGWLQGFIPAQLCYYLVTLDTARANMGLTVSILLAGTIAAVVGSLPAFIFALTMLPAGMVLGHAIRRNESPTVTGMKTVGLLLLLWTAFWVVYGAQTGTNPYQEIQASLEMSLTETASFYQKETGLTLTAKEEIAATIDFLRNFLRRILPALMAITAITTVWVNMMIACWLLGRHQPPARTLWPPYSQWRFPPPLVWGVIAGGIAVLLPVQGASTVGINILLVGGALYFFQGLAVLAKLFAKWSVPGPMRVFLYAISLFQGAGIIALAALGIADIWADFGTPRPD